MLSYVLVHYSFFCLLFAIFLLINCLSKQMVLRAGSKFGESFVKCKFAESSFSANFG